VKGATNHVANAQVNPIVPLVRTAANTTTALMLRAALVVRTLVVRTVLSEKTVTSDQGANNVQIVSNTRNAITEVVATNAPVMTSAAKAVATRVMTNGTTVPHGTIVPRATTTQHAVKSRAAVKTPAETIVLPGASPSAKRAEEGPVLEASALTVVALVAVPVVTPEHAAVRPVAAKGEASQAPATTEKMSFKSATRASVLVRKHIALTHLVS
jgi:hypothetical protein